MSRQIRSFPTNSSAGDDLLRQIEELQRALDGEFASLTDEERQELNNLEDMHNTEVKSFKISKFKSLPSAIRQTIVDSIVFHRNATEAIKGIPIPSERLSELRRKNNRLKDSFFVKSPTMKEIEDTISSRSKLGMPKYGYLDLSDDDILSAHSEACLEEQLNRSE